LLAAEGAARFAKAARGVSIADGAIQIINAK
jgi:hypothetical protein